MSFPSGLFVKRPRSAVYPVGGKTEILGWLV